MAEEDGGVASVEPVNAGVEASNDDVSSPQNGNEPAESAAEVSQDAEAEADEAEPENTEGEKDTGDEDPEEEYNDDEEPASVDEEVYKLKSHKRQLVDRAPVEPKEKRRPKGESRNESRGKSSPEPSRRRGVSREEPEEPEEPEDPAVLERRLLEERIDAALKPASKKRKRLTGDDLEQMQDEMIANLRTDMREAALSDASCVNEGQPAVHKQQLLKRVQDTLRQQGLAESILDGNLLESVRIWLEPLPDASLPSFEIQQTLFSALTALPIKTIHLRESGLGRIVAFYQKSRRPHPSIKRMAQKLIGDWTRPIIGRSDNYRDRSVDTASFDPMQAGRMRRRSEPLTPYEESAARRNRAALPQANNTRYSVAPVASAAPMQQQRATDSQLRRMKTKLLNNARQSRGKKSGVSVEGRGLN